MPSLRDALLPFRAIMWVARKVRVAVLQERDRRERAFKERIAIWRSRVQDAGSEEETTWARRGLIQVQNEFLSHLEGEILQLAKEVVQERAPTGIITADAPQLPPPEREALERAATIRAALDPPKTFIDHLVQANAIAAGGDRAGSLDEYNHALAIEPKNILALTNRGIVLGHLKRYKEALADFNRILELKPDDAIALDNRGVTLSHMGRHSDALADHTRALELAPDLANASYNRACAYSRMGQFKESLDDLRRSIDLDEVNRVSAREDEDFANLRSDPTFGPEFERLVAEPES